MYTGGSAEYLVDQGLYYPTTPNYGYYSTEFESPGDWDDHQRFFGLDGLDVQYTGAQTETVPYVYYTPSYGYAESPFNPYNPYIPGAMIGVDDPFAGAQPYYTTVPPYQTTVSSPSYFPVGAHSMSDTIPTSSQELLRDTGSPASNILYPGVRHNLSSPSQMVYIPSQAPTSNQTHPIFVPESSRVHAGPSNQAVTYGSTNSTSFRNAAPAHAQQGRNSSSIGQAFENESNGRVVSHPNQLQIPLSFSNSLSSNTNQHPPADNVQSNFSYGPGLVDVNGNYNAFTDQNRGPRTNKSKKLYTTVSGDGHAQGNSISIDQYNKGDFCINYVVAKFFVIKSYSEDDVHKSVKYEVWSSTPNGNKKLNTAFEDAQRIAGQSRHCPVFLFFSVNASGQFCGVAEMIGPVDFQRDMDFWQQDKWSGSFPVKWHIIKDIPNANFRHIVLENNENKPVTNSRDTQEIKYRQGLEMLKIFKAYTLKTSLVDDFPYYEKRQKSMQEEKARILMKSYVSPFFNNTADPPRKHAIRVEPYQANTDPLSNTNLSHNVVSVDHMEAVPSTSNISGNEQMEEFRGIEAKSEKLTSLTGKAVSFDSKGIEIQLEKFSLAGKPASLNMESKGIELKFEKVSSLAAESVNSDTASKENEGKMEKVSSLAGKSVCLNAETKGTESKIERASSSAAGRLVSLNTDSKGNEAKFEKVSVAGKSGSLNTESKGIEVKFEKIPSLIKNSVKSVSSSTDSIGMEAKPGKSSSLERKLASPSIDCKGIETKPEKVSLSSVSSSTEFKGIEAKLEKAIAGNESVPVVASVTPPSQKDVVKVGSVPVKVNGFATSFVTVGTISLDPTSLLADKSGVSAKGGKPQ